LRYKKLGLLEQVSYKKRYFDGTRKLKKSFGTAGIFTYKNCRFEYVYLNVIRRFLKLFLKLKYSKFQVRWIWIFLKGNFPIRKKSKNSRMGKGIGSFLRWSIRLPRGYSLVEFRGISIFRLKKLKNRWQKHLNFPIVLY
jgi:ribosomal protein L16/L10AE